MSKSKINIGTILTSLTTIAILGFVGAVWDFQNIKAEVSRNRSRLDVVSQIICAYAIKDELKDAGKICQDVIKGK